MKIILNSILNEFFVSINLIAININEVGSIKEPIKLVDVRCQVNHLRTLRYGFDDKTKNLIIVYKINETENHFEAKLDNRFLQLSEYELSSDSITYIRFFRLFLHTVDNKIVYIDFLKRHKEYNRSIENVLKYNYGSVLNYSDVETYYKKIDLI